MPDDSWIRDLGAGLPSREVHDEDPIIDQASGILLARLGTTIEEAVASLRVAAEVRRVDVAEVAADVVRSASRPPQG